MRYVTAVLLTLAALSFASSSWAMDQSLNHPPNLTPEQARTQYPWAYKPTKSQVPADQSVPVGLARNLSDDGQDKTLEALRQGNLPPVQESWGMDDPSRRQGGSVDWFNDFLVRSGSPPTWGKLSIDHAANGDLFVALLNPSSRPTDTVSCYRSTDAGRTWALSQYIIGTGDQATDITDCEVRIGPGANPFVYLYAVYDSGTIAGLWVRRMRVDGSGGLWTEVIAGQRTIWNISGDRDILSPSNLFVSWRIQGGGLLRASVSADSNATWSAASNISGAANNHSEIACGGNGYFYITYQVDTTTIRIGRNTSGLSGSWAFNDIVGQGVSEWWPTVAASRQMPGASQTAWVIFRNLHSPTGIDTHYGYSVNGGASWTAQVWPPTNIVNPQPNFPNIRVSYDYSVDLNSVVEPVYLAPYDSVVFAYATSADPTTWVDRVVVNDYRSTGEYGPKVDILMACGGAAVTYREYGSGNVWFDSWGNASGVEQGERPVSSLPKGLALASAQPNPLSKSTSIAFSLPKSGNADLAVYDISGRKVATLAKGTLSAGSHEVSWNGADAPAGVYLYRLSFEGKTLTNRMVVIK